MPTTRLAPSPTGALHLGNLRTFLINWAIARQQGWQVILRMEDLDGPRIKEDAAKQAIDLLQWIGIDWDEGPYYQTPDLEPYHQALRQLALDGKVYPCRCTRSQILAASLSAPNQGDHELRYPGTCRPEIANSLNFSQDPKVAWRVVTPDEEVTFKDIFAGNCSANPQQQVGDFLVATKGGAPSYQLAVVVDDARQGIDQVVRGDDLLDSTPRQMLLYQLLELGTPPTYTHLPIVVGSDGRRLAKRHGDSRIQFYREQGITPERVLGLLADWSGLGDRQLCTAQEFVENFQLSELSHEQVVFTKEDDAWLQA